MKFIRIFCLVLAMLMLGGVMVACGGGAETEAETDKETQAPVQEKDAINVNIIVKTAVDGEVKYQSGVDGYDYDGSVCTVQEILNDFMYMQYEIEIVVDEDTGKLIKVGDLETGDTKFFLFSQAKAPKGAEQAEAVDANIDEYDDIDNGDTLIIYLS